MEFLKTYCNLTEFEARECSDMLKVMIEEDSMGVDTAVLERLGNRGPSNSTESCCWYKKLPEKYTSYVNSLFRYYFIAKYSMCIFYPVTQF